MRPIQWIVGEGSFRPATLYTVHLLSSLFGRRAIILDEGASGDDSLPTIRYTTEDVASDKPGLHARPDLAFWNAVNEGLDIAPRGRQVWRDTVFPTWSQIDSRIPNPGGAETCPVDPIAAAFFLVSRIEEWRSTEWDRHGRFPAERAWMVKEGVIEMPLVHEYAAAIATAVGIRDPFETVRGVWPAGKQFAIAFTHDVDRVRMHGPLWQDCRRAVGALRFPGGLKSAIARLRSRQLVKADRRRDPYDTFDRIVEGHEAHGNRATFFFINSAPSVRNSDYRCDSDEITRRIRTLRSHGFEIGLHGSYESFESPVFLHKEKSGLDAATGSRVSVIRQHYLRFLPRKTWDAQVDSGFRIDSTLGFASRMGFRAGIAVPFQPWDFSSQKPFDIWEVPLIMMDGTAREYMRLGPEKAIGLSREILERVARVGGTAAVLWHNSSFDDIDWPGWENVYESWQNAAVELNGWGATLTSIVQSWNRYQDSLRGEC